MAKLHPTGQGGECVKVPVTPLGGAASLPSLPLPAGGEPVGGETVWGSWANFVTKQKTPAIYGSPTKGEHHSGFMSILVEGPPPLLLCKTETNPTYCTHCLRFLLFALIASRHHLNKKIWEKLSFFVNIDLATFLSTFKFWSPWQQAETEGWYISFITYTEFSKNIFCNCYGLCVYNPPSLHIEALNPSTMTLEAEVIGR